MEVAQIDSAISDKHFDDGTLSLASSNDLTAAQVRAEGFADGDDVAQRASEALDKVNKITTEYPAFVDALEKNWLEMPEEAENNALMQAAFIDLIKTIDGELTSIFFDGEGNGEGENWMNYQFYAISHPKYFDPIFWHTKLLHFYGSVE